MQLVPRARAKAATLLRMRVDPLDVVDLSSFSVRGPSDGECLLPLCTYLEVKSETAVPTIFHVGGLTTEVPLRVIDVVPQINQERR